MLLLIDADYLYIAQPPLYGLRLPRQKELEYVYDEAALAALQRKYKDRKYEIQRFKGLGELNAEQLWETTMNPETRILKRVTVDDFLEGSETF